MSLNEQATDPNSHTSVLILYPLLSCHLQNPLVDPQRVYLWVTPKGSAFVAFQINGI